MLRNSSENITGMLWLSQWKHKDPFSRRSSSGSSEQLSYRVRQKASINYSIITSCSREWFVLNWLNSSLPTWFLTEDSFQPSWDYISAPGCVFTTKSDDVKNYFIVRFPLGAFSDHQALQKLPGVTCQIQKQKKVPLSTLLDGGMDRLLTALSPFLPFWCTFNRVCVTHGAKGKLKACEIKNRALANTSVTETILKL